MNLEMAPLGTMLAALATGLVGSVHCVGMCGTATTALLSRSPAALASTSAPPGGLASIRVVIDGARASPAGTEPSLSSSLQTSLAFNLGRLASYAAAGAILAGVTGALASQIVLNDAMPLRISIYVIGQLFVIAIGCYVAGFTQFLAPLERAGSVIWRRVAPFTRRWSSPKNAGQAFLLGGLWGWIPCGMVYGALASAMSSGGAVAGAMVMFAFGLGTLPVMLMMGAIGPSLRRTLAGPNLRLVLGMIIIGVGVFGLSRVPTMNELAVFSKLCVWVNNAVPSVLSIAAR
jgi:uncharacterized protein